MSKVIWLPEALADTLRLRQFLENQSLAAAARAGQVIQAGTKRLADFPEIGQPMADGTERRELYLPFGAGGYILRYIIDDHSVVIIRAWHTKEKRDES